MLVCACVLAASACMRRIEPFEYGVWEGVRGRERGRMG